MESQTAPKKPTNKLTYSIRIISDGPLKGCSYSSQRSIEDCRTQAHEAGFFTGTMRCYINGIQFPLAACQNLTALVKNKKGQWTLAPMPKV